MTHMVLYNFPEGTFKEEYKILAEKTFGELKKEISGISAVNIYTNCIKRDVNYDLLVAIDVDSEESLKEYLVHPLHKNFSAEMDKYITGKARIDINR